MIINRQMHGLTTDRKSHTHFLEAMCAQLDLFASAQGGDRAVATRLIDHLREQEQDGEDMIRLLATSLQIVAEQEVAAQKAGLDGLPSIFTDKFN